jgi:dolichyl-phosphate-mannose-protein mannosyltransferase
MATDTGLRAADGSPGPDGPDRTGDAHGAARRALAAAWVLPLVLLLVATGLRLYRLDEPARTYFDEVYYAEDGAALLRQGVEDGFVVHPPAGKWVIAAGIAVAGDGPFGWRVGMALAGSLTVLMTYLAGLRLFRRRGIAALAAFLVAVDGLAFTMSRIAMLDSALALLVVTAFWLLLRDRDALLTGIPETPPDPAAERPLPRRPHRDRWLAGLVLGLAIATKWSGVLAIGGAGLLVLGTELVFRRRTTGRWLAGWPRLVAATALPLVVVPAAVYVLSYAGWFASYELTRPGAERCPPGSTCAVPLPQRLADWAGEQRAIARFHDGLDATHQYRSPASTWPLLLRPVAYYYESCTERARLEKAAAGERCELADDHVAEILGMGNPAIWWLALLAYPVLAWAALRRRSWPAAAIGVLLLAQYVPWLIASRPLFLFYMTPVVPFIALAVAFAADRAAEHPLARWVPAGVAALALAGFLFWYPVWSGAELPEDQWRLRMWSERWI